ncbi:hypothetical protein ARMSODRAFT_1005896 [Armillaria solidipes]|uniref:Uncharacterized protein n=1 Tax=Armillaria solidipes TaxID=1076256 RepID=A0A2H3B7F4_9AGAR|nr:hypothetical protein ARMSODRAFT_1005896 [Armillaria solidipes]
MTSFDFDVVSPADLTVTQLDETVAVAVRAYDSNPSIQCDGWWKQGSLRSFVKGCNSEEQRALRFDSVYASLSEETKYGLKIKEFMNNALGKTAIQDKGVMVVGADSDLKVRIYESFGFKLKGRTVLASSVKGESYPLFVLKKIP